MIWGSLLTTRKGLGLPLPHWAKTARPPVRRSLIFAAAVLLGMSTMAGQSGSAASTGVLAVSGTSFTLNSTAFKMWGIRVASASQSEELTDMLVANLDAYKSYGVNTVTVFYQGSSGGYSNPFSPDGNSIDSGDQSRMERIIQEADKRGMVVIVGLFYQNAPFDFNDAEAVKQAVRTATSKLKPYRNVIINIANEQNTGNWEDSSSIYDIRDPQKIIDLCKIVHDVDAARIVGGGGYDQSNNAKIGNASEVDTLLFDSAGIDPTTEQLYDELVADGVNDKPLVNVELFGAWTKEFLPPGVFPEEARKEYISAIASAATHPAHSVFFHNNPWIQGESMGYPNRYNLAGGGTSSDPGIRWYFEEVKKSQPTSNTLTIEDATINQGELLFAQAQIDTATSPSQVQFYIDGKLAWTEYYLPYCLGGDNKGTPRGYDTDSLSAATHTLKAVATVNGQSYTSATVQFTLN